MFKLSKYCIVCEFARWLFTARTSCGVGGEHQCVRSHNLSSCMIISLYRHKLEMNSLSISKETGEIWLQSSE